MEIKLVPSQLPAAKVGLLALPLNEEDLGKRGSSPHLDRLDRATRGFLREVAKQEKFTAKAGQCLVFHVQGRLEARKVMLIGLGARAKSTAENVRRAAGAAAKEAARSRSTKLAFGLPDVSAETIRAAAEGLALGAYRFDKWRSKADDKHVEVKQGLLVSPELTKDDASSEALALATTLADAVNWARDLVNEPGMTMTPPILAKSAADACKAAGCTVELFDRKKIEALKMGMFLGVAQGSVEPPLLLRICYTPKDKAAASRPPLALVGKAITFDSGGLSLKPADAMVDMKTDMAGSAAVFGAMQVIAKVLKPSFPVHAFVGTCENMPSGSSYRPGDVLRSRLGKTVEITNTDAEGRLVLGDVLSFACEENPRGIVDLATLTGACIVALGNYTVGAFGHDDELMESVLGAAKTAGEDFWRLPMTPEVKDNLKSDIADMKNSGARWGGAISAAHFLSEFVGDTPWVHLDIAGPSTSDKDKDYSPKGATGVGVRTLVELVRALDAA